MKQSILSNEYAYANSLYPLWFTSDREQLMTGKHKIQRVWVDETSVRALTEDGLQASYPFSMWKRLANATPEQRQNFYLSYTGIHWRDIDEDLSFEGMFADAGLCERTSTEDSVYYEADYLTKIGDEEELNKVAED